MSAPARRSGRCGGTRSAVDAIDDELGEAADLGGHDRQADRHRLHDGDRQAFVVGGEAEDVTAGHDPHRVGAEAEQPESIAEAELVVEASDLLLHGALPDGDEAGVVDGVEHLPGGGQQVGPALRDPEIGDGDDDELVLDPELAPHLVPVRSVRGHGIDVDAVADDLGRRLEPVRHRVAHGGRNREAGVVVRGGHARPRSGSADVALPQIVFGRHHAGPVLPRSVRTRSPRGRPRPASARGRRRSRGRRAGVATSSSQRRSAELVAPRQVTGTPADSTSPTRAFLLGVR